MNRQTLPVPPLDPLVRAAIVDAISRNPRDLSLTDALTRLHGHLGIDRDVYISAFVDHVLSGAFGAFPVAGPQRAHRPASAAPAPQLRRGPAAYEPYRRPAPPVASAPSSRAPYTVVTQSDLAALAEFRYTSGKKKRDWRRFMAEIAPRLHDRLRFWQEADRNHAQDILKLVAKLEADAHARAAREDSPPVQRSPLRPAPPDIEPEPATPDVEPHRPHNAASGVQLEPDARGPDHRATPDVEPPRDAANDAQSARIRGALEENPAPRLHATPDVKSDTRELMGLHALNFQPIVKPDAQAATNENAPDVKPDIKPDINHVAQWPMDEDTPDVKPNVKPDVEPDAQSLTNEDAPEVKPDPRELMDFDALEAKPDVEPDAQSLTDEDASDVSPTSSPTPGCC